MRHAKNLCPAALLGALTLLLSSCASTGAGLIPAQNAGPLQSDFEAVARAAQAGDGNCAATATAIRNTERHFEALPDSINPALHARLREGIANLRDRALVLCAQPLPSATTTSSSHSTSTSTSTTTTTVSPTETSTSTTSIPLTPPPGGGTQAPGEPGEGGEVEPGTHAEEGGGTDGNGQGAEP